MNRQNYGQHRGLFGAVEASGGRYRSLSKSVKVGIGRCWAAWVSFLRWTQNPPAYGLTSSSLVPGISFTQKGLDTFFGADYHPVAPRPTDRKTDKSREIAILLRIRDVEREREITLINVAFKSGTTRLLG